MNNFDLGNYASSENALSTLPHGATNALLNEYSTQSRDMERINNSVLEVLKSNVEKASTHEERMEATDKLMDCRKEIAEEHVVKTSKVGFFAAAAAVCGLFVVGAACLGGGSSSNRYHDDDLYY